MAKVLTTKASAATLEDIIRKANRELLLISYSFIISTAFLKRIKQAAERGVIVKIIYGKSIKREALGSLHSMKNVVIMNLDSLHAKIFANETKCIIGSMNFSEASELQNTELGVCLTLKDDPSAFKDAIDHCREIIEDSKTEWPIVQKKATAKTPKTEQSFKPTKSGSKKTIPLGYCIRTRKRIPLNHLSPYCPEAYATWAMWEDRIYQEKYDHFTGEETNGQTCMATPILYKNWEDYQSCIGNDSTI